MKQANRKVYYCHPSDTVRMGGVSNPHPLTVALTDCLLRHAHCWALDMTDWPGGRPSAQEQRISWERAMEDADKECRKIKDAAKKAEEVPINPLSQLLSG